MGLARLLLGVAAVAALAEGAGADTGAIVVPSADAAVDAMALTAALAASGVDEPDAIAAARAARRAGAEPVEVVARFAEVSALMAEGWRAYAAADPEFAAARLAAARTAALDLLTLDGGRALYADASLRLGVALLHLGRGAEADDALRLAHALDGERAVTTAEFTPEAVAAYGAAWARPRTEVEVRIDALGGAAVEVDGLALGAAPLTARLTTGAHVIAVSHPRYQARAIVIEVDATTPLVAVELPPDRDGAVLARAADSGLAGLGDSDAARVIDLAALYADVDDVLVVASIMRAGAPALLGQRCTGGRACTAVVEVGYADAAGLPAALAQLRARLAAADARYGVVLADDPRVTRGGTRVVGGGCDGCRRRWYWIGGGVVAAAALAATVIVLTRGEGAPSVMIDPGDFTTP